MATGIQNAQIRDVGVYDLPRLVAAPWSAGLPEKHAERFAMQERGAAVYLVALVDERIIGHLLLKWDGPDGDTLRAQLAPCAEIEDFVVMPEYRSRGIGSALLDHATHLAADRGKTRLGLAVGVENDRARALYERAGFAQVDVPPFDVRWQYRTQSGELAWEGERCVYMMKKVGERG